MRPIRLGFLALVGVVMASHLALAAGNPPALVEAVKNGNTEAVKGLLKTPGAIHALDVDGSTAMHWAVHRDDFATVKLLLAAGADVNVTTRYGVAPLALACINGNAQIVGALLKAGADANGTQRGGETALMTAARTGKVDTVRLLLAYGADVNAVESTRGQNALMWAADEGNADTVAALLEAGANLKAKSKGPEKAGKGRIDAITPLMFAVRAGHIATAKVLLDAGANANDLAEDGTSALTMTIANGHWEMAEYLLDHGADPKASGQGWTALHQLVRTRNPNIGQMTGPVQTGRVSSLDLAKKLVAKGADVNARMTKDMNDRQRTRIVWKGCTPLLLAAKASDVEMMHVLMDLGADPKATNEVGSTVLMLAAGLAMYHVSEDSGSDSASLASTTYALEIGGGDVNAVDADGDTALHGAAQRFAPETARLLIEHGGKLDVKNAHGATPLMMANGFSVINMQKQPALIDMFKKEMTARNIPIEMWPAGQANIDQQVFDVDPTAAEVGFRHGDTGEAQAARLKAAAEAKAKADAEAAAKAAPKK
jgi:ankyrin repeat protein